MGGVSGRRGSLLVGRAILGITAESRAWAFLLGRIRKIRSDAILKSPRNFPGARRDGGPSWDEAAVRYTGVHSLEDRSGHVCLEQGKGANQGPRIGAAGIPSQPSSRPA